MSGSSEDRRRRRRRPADLDDELEEGECAPWDHSSSDTEDYYNRDAASSGESEETISDLDDATASSAAAPNHKSNSTASSAASPNHNHHKSNSAAANHNGGGSRAHSVLANHNYGSARACLTAADHYGRASASSASANLSFASAAAVAGPMIACRVCGKEFSSEKAVCGHMKVHAQEALHHGGKEQQGNGKRVKKERSVAVAGGWGVTGRRGCSGWGSATSMDIAKGSPDDEPDHPMDIVPPEPKIVYAPTPVAFAMPEDVPSVPMASARANISGESSSKKPMPDDGMDIASAGANPIPPTEPVVHQQAAAPAPAPAPAPPPAGKQAQVVRHKRAPRPSAGRQNPAGYRCKDPACNAWYQTHQALGGHIAGHKNRRLAAEGMPHDGAGPSSGGGSREARPHPCRMCGKQYSKGVQLGGHMRMHFEGKIVPKRKLRPIEPLPPPSDVAAGSALKLCRPADAQADDLTLALPIKAELQSLAPAVDAGQQAPAAAAEGTPESSPGPRGTGRVILFGIDIGLGVQTPPGQEGSPATKDSSASTGDHTEQQ